MSGDVEKRYYVDFGPELLKLLGPNLYTNIYYVLGEIIANAYDADAENVYVMYNTDTNSITIEDDGNGMSYNEINDKFLPIGISTRDTTDNTFSAKGRKRMGRKGIGKLAALSVADKVKIISKKNNEESGCELSLHGTIKNEEGKYEIPGLKDSDISFVHINDIPHGSAIIMENSRYLIHKSVESAKRNLSLIFPFACQEFKIHLENVLTKETAVIEDIAKDIVSVSDSLITFSDVSGKYHTYLNSFHDEFDEDRYYDIIKRSLPEDDLPDKVIRNRKENAIHDIVCMKANDGTEKEFELVIEGWIATYASSRDKKKKTDFPVNHISIISNDKLGQFDILPDISTDRMQEAYVVGQFYVDLLEETTLPDIAASNRQGYKEDDLRIIKTKELIKSKALRPILELKQKATKEKNYLKDLDKQASLKKSKDEFDKTIRSVIEDPAFKSVIKDSKNIKSSLEIGWQLKDTLNDSYRKVMISHAREDKELIDELEKILHFCGFQRDEIIYTSSDYYESGFTGAYTNIYDFLQDFFVNTTKKNDLSVIYILNDNFIHKWDPTLEAGAGWVLDTKRFPMFTDDASSLRSPFECNAFTPRLQFGLTEKEAHYLASAIFQVCQNAKKHEKTEADIFSYIETSTRLVAYK